MTMIDIYSPSFWISISFFITLLISFKVVLPPLLKMLDEYRRQYIRQYEEAQSHRTQMKQEYEQIKQKLNDLDLKAREEVKNIQSLHQKMLGDWQHEKQKVRLHMEELFQRRHGFIKRTLTEEFYRKISAFYQQTLVAYYTQVNTPLTNEHVIEQQFKDLIMLSKKAH